MSKILISSIIVGTLIAMTFCFAPKLFAVLLLLSIVVGVVSFFKWMLK